MTLIDHANPIDPGPGGALTSVDHWDAGWTDMPSRRFWSPFDPTTRDVYSLLEKNLPIAGSFLEIGFAPGKHLAWAALSRRASVAGIDYSSQGVAISKAFFEKLGIEGDLRNEDVFETSFPEDAFDCVFSNGVIEHFENPRPIVAKHVALARPGGRIIIVYPHYGGIYGRLQHKLDPANLKIHNLEIMSPEGARALFDMSQLASLETYAYGRPALSGLALSAVMPTGLAKFLQRTTGIIGQMVPRSLSPAKPMMCAVAVKAGEES